jgi:transketolase
VGATGAATSRVDLDSLAINTIRFLAADAVQAANSGHPGLPMGAAPMAYALWTRHLKHDPGDPSWPDRDRFILSAGHGSMLLYALLHLTGYDLSLDDIRHFRQWGSRTPGHPERHVTPGVEATTGPLGQGLANAVGFAIAEAHLAARFNRDGHRVVDHMTYVLASDGDLMEGVTSEASSLAGFLRLGKLVVLYDDNHVSLAGTTNLAWAEDVGARYAAYGWHVSQVEDGTDVGAIDRAIAAARAQHDRPSLIRVHTLIGYGAPHKEGTFEAHGSPLGPDELRAAKVNLEWPLEPAFWIPPEALAVFRTAQGRGREQRERWEADFARYAAAHAEPAAEFRRRMAQKLPPGWDADLPTFPADPKGVATRKAGETVLQTLAGRLPEIVGGSADLNPSTLTWIKGTGDFASPLSPSDGVQGRIDGPWGYEGRNLHFGVREHAMGSAVNGMALHGGFIPYGSTFLVFSDYMRPAIRLSALTELGSVWVFTHDGIGVGEDGPTHQPVEHYAALRAIPGSLFFRPCDANETVEAWRLAIANRHRPSCLALTRQNVPTLDRARFAPAAGVAQGAYVLNPDVTAPRLVLMATGSEVQYIVAAAETLASRGIAARLVSMPCWKLFEEQPQAYRDSVLPPAVTARLAVETGVALGWHRWVGSAGRVLSIDRFGASAPAPEIARHLGFTPEHVVELALEVLG